MLEILVTTLFFILGGLLVRADGWGPEDEKVAATWPKWKLKASQFFDVWTCSILFAILCYIHTGDLWALSAGLAFFIWRLPGFHGWEKWGEMFWRGLWTSAIGFGAMSLIIHGNVNYGSLCLPMGALMALAYCGPYNWLVGRIKDSYVHIVAEISSGIFFIILTHILLEA